jgi:hypothetical protein
MGQTVSLWTMRGVSKAKTAKAILFLNTETNHEAWIPLTVASVRFIGKDYKVQVTVPGWFYGKIQWKQPSTFTPKAKPANPYMGADVGNMMEERMVLAEVADSETGEHKQKLLDRIALIDEAVKAACA